MPRARPLKTDIGTVLLHWVLAIALAVALATGVRLASDFPALGWLRVVDAVLPSEQLWFRHVMAGSVLMAGALAYAVYLAKARLFQRIRLDRPRLAGLFRPGATRWSAANVLVLWLFFLALSLEMVTGVAIFLGAGGNWAALHLSLTWICLLFPVAHVGLHWGQGGWRQLLRVVQPSPLALPPPPPDFAQLLAEHLGREGNPAEVSSEAPEARLSRTAIVTSNPLSRAFAAALVLGVLVWIVERATRPILRVPAIDRAAAPVIDGDLSDPVWSRLPVVEILTRHGANLGGTGESRVEVRAAHDNEFVYFAFTWTDPTRSLKHLPLVKRQDGWHVLQTAHDIGDENAYFEDRFAVLLANPGLALIGAAMHFASAPLRHHPGSLSGRGLHYTSDHSVLDVWLWRASHGGSIGRVENCHIGAPAEPEADQRRGSKRYAGGYTPDPHALAFDNFEPEPPGGYREPVKVRRLPKSLPEVHAALGRLDEDTSHSESEGARWWMTESQSVPYSAETDDTIPVGAIIPGVVAADNPDPRALTIRGLARWSAGRWTLEIVRKLDTGNKWDVPIRSGVLMWVAVFDHTETRHTWHLRPLTLEID